MMPHVSREAECSPHLNGRVSTALAATVLVVMAVLIATGALLLIVTLIPPVIHAWRYLPPYARAHYARARKAVNATPRQIVRAIKRAIAQSHQYPSR
jgi:hypothetical protein